MSGIPTTFKDGLPEYSVPGSLGGERRGSGSPPAVLLRNRNPPRPNCAEIDRRKVFSRLEKANFGSVLSFELQDERQNIEELASSFPFVHFIILKNDVNAGVQLNLAAGELFSPCFFALRQDFLPPEGFDASNLHSERLCTAPLITLADDKTSALVHAPLFGGGRFNVGHFTPAAMNSDDKDDGGDGVFQTLYPTLGLGLYDRERFIRLGGFDAGIRAEYWQLLDFGMRGRLWGEETAVSAALKLESAADGYEENAGIGKSYRRFFLKNLAPRLSDDDGAYLPLGSFLPFWQSSRLGPLRAWEEFRAAREWVGLNRYRWRSDAAVVVRDWGRKDGTTPPAIRSSTTNIPDSCTTAGD
jgi:hypothetical protein